MGAVKTATATFDVFDTLLVRAVGDPDSVFLLMGRLEEVGRITGTAPEQFARLRRSAQVRSRYTRAEATLSDIYRELGRGLGLPEDAWRRLGEIELELERRLSRVVPGAERLLESEPGHRLAVSDMYLPGSFVEELLAGHGLRRLFDDVVVSSEVGATKSSGELYVHLRKRLGSESRHWRHYGDNRSSDVRVPKALGVDSTHVARAKLNRYEELWEDYRWETGGLSSLLSGAARLTRLGTEAPPGLGPIVDVASGVAAPVLVSYVLWVLRSARRQGIERLYFLARDGEILFRLARRLSERLGWGIGTSYLYGSRSVYHRARLAQAPLAEATWAWSGMYRLTAGAALARLGLTAAESAPLLAELGLDESGDLDADAVDRIRHDARLEAAVKARSAALLERVQAYLRQEGLADGVPYAVVDTGWAGRIIGALADVLPEGAPPLRRGYLFGYIRDRGGFDRPDVLQGYLFDEYAGTGARLHVGETYGLEIFTVADEGMTTDFQPGPEGWEPRLASEHNPALALAHWPWDLYRDVVGRFVDNLVLDPDLAEVGADLRSPVAAALREFWTRPTEDEARAWGAYPYEDDVLATSRNPLAHPIRVRDFAGKARSSYQGKRLWLEGSVALSSPWLRPPARAGLWLAEERRRAGEKGRRPGASRWRDRIAVARLAVRTRLGRP